MRSENDIKEFYRLYKPEYPEILGSAIAKRIAGIVEKSRSGEALTETEVAYVERSKAEPSGWDWEAELRQQETVGKVHCAVKKLEELMK